MLSWFQALMPKEEKFFDFFERHAQTLVDGSKSLRELLDGGPGVADACARIAADEHKADGIAQEVMLAVRRTFITPFDRSDIQSLITAMDDAIDQMQQTAKAITLYEVREFDGPMREMADIAIEASGLTVKLVSALRQMNKKSAQIAVLASKMIELEEKSDVLHDAGIKALFQKHRTGNAMDFIVGSEIYSHLEKVVDRFEDVANSINAIVIEHL